MQTNRANGAPQDQGQSNPGAKPKTATFRTLVVDGDNFMSPAVEKALEGQGHLILTADSAKTALEKTRQFQPDLILLDSGIQGSQSLELLGELLIEQASAAVVVVARNPSIAEAVLAIKMGALDYLVRPIEAKTIAQVSLDQQAWFKDA